VCSDEVFSSRASLDALFQSSRKESHESADVLLVTFKDGSINLSIYDFFEIGSFLPEQISSLQGNVIQHCSHPLSSTHALLSSTRGKGVYFHPLDLRLLPATGRYLSLLASKSTQLLNILRYMKDVQVQIYNEFKVSQDLPMRFMQNIEETLQEKEENNFVNAAYQLAAAGFCSPAMKEWLVDELGERVCISVHQNCEY
jgi:anaphase-promoting complex subunit 4